MPIPSVGRIVHYVTRESDHPFPEGNHLAALVTEVFPPGPDYGQVRELQVFFPRFGAQIRCSVPEDQEGTEAGTWHWPERDEP